MVERVDKAVDMGRGYEEWVSPHHPTRMSVVSSLSGVQGGFANAIGLLSISVRDCIYMYTMKHV